MQRARRASSRTPMTTTGMTMSRRVWWLRPLLVAAAAAAVDVAAVTALMVEAGAEAGDVDEREGVAWVATAVSTAVTAPPAREMNTLRGLPVVSWPRTGAVDTSARAARA